MPEASHNDDRGIMIDTPAGIAAYRALALYHALKLETKGLKHSRFNVAAIIRKDTGLPQRKKIDLLAAYEKHLKDEGILK